MSLTIKSRFIIHKVNRTLNRFDGLSSDLAYRTTIPGAYERKLGILFFDQA